MKAVSIFLQLLCLSACSTTVQGGFFGSSSRSFGFLGVEVQPKLSEEPFYNVEEDAEPVFKAKVTVEKATDGNGTVNSTASPTAASNNATQRPKSRSREAKLIASMRNAGPEGEESVHCVTHCRYGDEVRHTWHECLKR